MEKSSLYTGGPIPSYEEAVRQHGRPPRPQTATGRLAEIRKARVRELVDKIIEPLIDEQVESGMFRSCFAFVPSDALPARPPAHDGLPPPVFSWRHEFDRVVPLVEPADSTRFFQQASVVGELESSLRQYLSIDAEPSKTDSKVDGMLGTRQSPSRAREAAPAEGRSFKEQGKALSSSQIPMFSQASAGWRFETGFPSSGASWVQVSNEDVNVRIENEMGLYETRNCSVLVVKVQIGEEDMP